LPSRLAFAAWLWHLCAVRFPPPIRITAPLVALIFGLLATFFDYRLNLALDLARHLNEVRERADSNGLRLAKVSAATAVLKEDQDAMGAELLTQAAEFTTGNVVNLIARLINSARRFNLIVTNVPGPPVPFFLLSARMVAAYPHLPLFENQGLGVALLSYAGTLSWGIGADWNQMPDLADFMSMLAESFEELREAAGLAAPAAAAEMPLIAHPGGAAATPSAARATARGTVARRRVGSAAGGPPRAVPGPRLERGRSSRS